MPDKKQLKMRDFQEDSDSKTRFVWKKLLLFILSTIFDILVLLNIIFLITGCVSPVPGIILLIVSIGFSLLCKSLWRRSTAGLGTIITLFIIASVAAVILCAYAGIEPFASVKKELFVRVSETGTRVWEKMRSAVEFLGTFFIENR